MKELITVELKNVRFFAFHGIHALEQKTGTDFIVNLNASYINKQITDFQISDTINYVSLFEIVKLEMSKPTALLENLLAKIETAIHNQFPDLYEIEISIEKLNPPIVNMCGHVGVSLKKTY
jgi:7,8-dihydroneopterin aldolase/epimerase/oxygenase